ncbi:hypothetical protein IWQ62_005423, partial [Dispira parvispora]
MGFRTSFWAQLSLPRSALVILSLVLTCGSLYSAHQSSFYLDTQERFFLQRTDHFAPPSNNSQVFPQRLFINDKYYQANGPILLLVGGQQSLIAKDANRPSVVHLAQKTGGLIVALEHRYYGLSNPMDNLTTDALSLLSMDQAVEDVAYFIQSNYIEHILHDKHRFSSLFSLAQGQPTPLLAGPSNLEFFDEIDHASDTSWPTGSSTAAQDKEGNGWASYSSSQKLPWILLGFSYAGTVAVRTKAQYPELVNAVLASSTPLHGHTNFQGLDSVMADRISCPADIHYTIRYLDEEFLTQSDGLARLNRAFGVGQWPRDPALVAEYLAQPLTTLAFNQDDNVPFADSPAFIQESHRSALELLCQKFEQTAGPQSLHDKAQIYVQWVQSFYQSRSQSDSMDFSEGGERLASPAAPMVSPPPREDPLVLAMVEQGNNILGFGSSRQRLWQMCTDFPLWFTTSSSVDTDIYSNISQDVPGTGSTRYQLRSRLLTSDYYFQRCLALFPEARHRIINPSDSYPVQGDWGPLSSLTKQPPYSPGLQTNLISYPEKLSYCPRDSVKSLAWWVDLERILFIDGAQDPLLTLSANALDQSAYEETTSKEGTVTSRLLFEDSLVNRAPRVICQKCQQVMVPDQGHDPLFRQVKSKHMRPFYQYVHRMLQGLLNEILPAFTSSHANGPTPSAEVTGGNGAQGWSSCDRDLPTTTTSISMGERIGEPTSVPLSPYDSTASHRWVTAEKKEEYQNDLVSPMVTMTIPPSASARNRDRGSADPLPRDTSSLANYATVYSSQIVSSWWDSLTSILPDVSNPPST